MHTLTYTGQNTIIVAINKSNGFLIFDFINLVKSLDFHKVVVRFLKTKLL